MRIEITPIDTLFFRDGKPFSKGEDVWASGIFPPHPSVFYGALRSKFFSENMELLPKAGTREDITSKLIISEVGFKIGNQIFYTLPLDLVREKDETVSVPLELIPNKQISSLKTEYYLGYKNQNKIESIQNGLIKERLFRQYLNKGRSEYFYSTFDKHIKNEPKIGIAINKKSGTVEEGQLYRVDTKRLTNYDNTESVSFVIKFDNLDLSQKSGMLKLGAENKAVSYKVLENNSPIEPGDFKKRFKMVLTTPAIFDNGWFPGNIDPKTFIYDNNGLKIKLLSAAVGKKLFIGGWDMKNNKPKKMYRAVPAGSVYYFELISGNPEDIIQKFHMKSISDIRPKEGFGITYIGGADD